MTTIHTSFDLVLTGKYEDFYKENPELIHDLIRETLVNEKDIDTEEARVLNLNIAKTKEE